MGSGCSSIDTVSQIRQSFVDRKSAIIAIANDISQGKPELETWLLRFIHVHELMSRDEKSRIRLYKAFSHGEDRWICYYKPPVDSVKIIESELLDNILFHNWMMIYHPKWVCKIRGKFIATPI